MPGVRGNSPADPGRRARQPGRGARRRRGGSPVPAARTGAGRPIGPGGRVGRVPRLRARERLTPGGAGGARAVPSAGMSEPGFPETGAARVHILHEGYVREARQGNRVASTVVLIIDGERVIVVDPGMVA